MEAIAAFAATFAALYAGHHVGDYWVQTDHQAKHKGASGTEGRTACLLHVGSYTLTQALCLVLLSTVTGWVTPFWAGLVALAVSAATHYTADRREHGLMFKLARLLPGKADFMRLGVPRSGVRIESWAECPDCEGSGRTDGYNSATDDARYYLCPLCKGGGRVLGGAVGDLPSLGTGAWALDQSWHLALGVFVPALILAAFA